MRYSRQWLLVGQAALIAFLAVGLNRHWFPLGVPGQWEWLRVKVWPTPTGMLMSLAAVGGFAGVAALGFRSLTRPSRAFVFREAGWLAGLYVAAVAAQFLVQAGAADEYDLTKWAYVNYFPSSTGYYKVAHEQMVDSPGKFLADYSDWISRQDSLHIGTHPPGLFVAHWFLARKVSEHSGLVSILTSVMPIATKQGFRQVEIINQAAVSRSDQASLFLVGILTLLASAGTVVPLYLLARASRGAPLAWCAASLWPLASSPVLFQPVADTIYPLLSTSALALVCWASRERSGRALGIILALFSGLILGIGMFCSLVFLAVGLCVGIVIATSARNSVGRRLMLILAVGIGFLAMTGMIWVMTGSNPFVTWWWNQHHHARFYDEFPRSYWAWFIANPIEMAVVIGLPTTLWCAVGFTSPRREGEISFPPQAAWVALAVLIALDVLGRNLGEVARLWQPFMPPLFLAASAGLLRWNSGPRTLFATVALIGLQTIILQTAIQVVYPV